MFRCLALVVIPALAFSCCPPKQWEGRQYVAIGSTAMDGSSHYTEVSYKRELINTTQVYVSPAHFQKIFLFPIDL